jgi:hypothetical protein
MNFNVCVKISHLTFIINFKKDEESLAQDEGRVTLVESGKHWRGNLSAQTFVPDPANQTTRNGAKYW